MDKFVLYFNALEPRIVDKETIIRALEEEIESLKNWSGPWVAGRSMGYGCLVSTDEDGTEWFSRWDKNELHSMLNDPSYYRGEQ